MISYHVCTVRTRGVSCVACLQVLCILRYFFFPRHADISPPTVTAEEVLNHTCRKVEKYYLSHYFSEEELEVQESKGFTQDHRELNAGDEAEARCPAFI